MRNRFLLTWLTALVVTVLAGCGKNESDAPAQDTVSPKGRYRRSPEAEQAMKKKETGKQ